MPSWNRSPRAACHVTPPGPPSRSRCSADGYRPAAQTRSRVFLTDGHAGCVLRPLCQTTHGTDRDHEVTTEKRSRRSNPVWWAWLDLSQRPHPYQQSRAHRYATLRSFRSRTTVRGQGCALATSSQAVPASHVASGDLSMTGPRSSRYGPSRTQPAGPITRRHQLPASRAKAGGCSLNRWTEWTASHRAVSSAGS
jgi:hypothetical protein